MLSLPMNCLPPTHPRNSTCGYVAHSRRGISTIKVVLSLALLVTGGFVAFSIYGERFGFPAAAKLPGGLIIEKVRHGNLEVSLTESGSLESAANVTVASQVEGSSVIIKIAEEGTRATKGQILVELDSSNFRTQATQQQIQMEQALASLKKAEEDLAIQATQNRSDISATELKIRLATLDLEKYENGDYQLEKSGYDGEKKLADEELRRALEKYEHTKRISKKGYATQAELEADRIAVETARIKASAASQKRDVLDKYTQKRQLEEKRANIEEFGRELDRVKRKAASSLVQCEANLKAAKLTADVEKAKYDKLNRQIEACTIIAPQDGLVVFANQRNQGGRGGGGQEVIIQEGAAVRERQAIINLPDVTKMQVSARIHESKIDQVREGLPCRIRVEALPGESFSGVVQTVSLVPLSANWPNMNVKEYAAVIKITDAVDRISGLKPGLTAQIEILIDRMTDVDYVPIQSVVERAGKSFAWVVAGERLERRQLVATRSSDSFTAVSDGLKEGEQIVVNPRSALSELVAQLDSEFPVEKVQTKGIEGQLPPAEQSAAGRGPGKSPGESAGGGRGDKSGGERSGERRGGPQAGGDPAERFRQQDTNSDGKITVDEASERLKERFTSVDTNGDQGIDMAEYQAMIQQFMQRPPGGGGPPAGGPVGGG